MSHKPRVFYKFLSLFLCFSLFLQQAGFAQLAGELNIAGYMSSLRQAMNQDKFRPLHLRYFSYNPKDNNFKIILDKGDVKDLNESLVEDASKAALKYFLVGVSLPNETFWVNLRPDSPDNMIDGYLAQTDVGKIMLESDLQLKKDTAGFTSPQTPEGRVYWSKLYQKAGELFGSGNITIPTLTRPWIVPGEIIISETNDSAYIYKASLKVMLESDYLSSQPSAISYQQYQFKDEKEKQLNDYSTQLIRELIIPKLTKEINTAKRYAALRQVYYSLIMAQWFKSRFRGKGGSYGSLIDQQNLQGLTVSDPYSRNAYFAQYQKSFKDGEYNIREPIQTPFGQTIRSYFSGGEMLNVPMPQPGETSGQVQSIMNQRGAQPAAAGLLLATGQAGLGDNPVPSQIILRKREADPVKEILVQGNFQIRYWWAYPKDYVFAKEGEHRQGHKLYVAATEEEAAEILSIVEGVLKEKGITQWKVLSSTENVNTQNIPFPGNTQIGKFICIYFRQKADDSGKIFTEESLAEAERQAQEIGLIIDGALDSAARQRGRPFAIPEKLGWRGKTGLIGGRKGSFTDSIFILPNGDIQNDGINRRISVTGMPGAGASAGYEDVKPSLEGAMDLKFDDILVRSDGSAWKVAAFMGDEISFDVSRPGAPGKRQRMAVSEVDRDWQNWSRILREPAVSIPEEDITEMDAASEEKLAKLMMDIHEKADAGDVKGAMAIASREENSKLLERAGLMLEILKKDVENRAYDFAAAEARKKQFELRKSILEKKAQTIQAEALAVAPAAVPALGNLPDYSGSGNTSIHDALARARRLVGDGKIAEARALLEELRADLAAVRSTEEIGPLMDKWNARFPSGLEVDLLFQHIPAAIADIDALLASPEAPAARAQENAAPAAEAVDLGAIAQKLKQEPRGIYAHGTNAQALVGALKEGGRLLPSRSLEDKGIFVLSGETFGARDLNRERVSTVNFRGFGSTPTSFNGSANDAIRYALYAAGIDSLWRGEVYGVSPANIDAQIAVIEKMLDAQQRGSMSLGESNIMRAKLVYLRKAKEYFQRLSLAEQEAIDINTGIPIVVVGTNSGNKDAVWVQSDISAEFGVEELTIKIVATRANDVERVIAMLRQAGRDDIRVISFRELRSLQEKYVSWRPNEPQSKAIQEGPQVSGYEDHADITQNVSNNLDLMVGDVLVFPAGTIWKVKQFNGDRVMVEFIRLGEKNSIESVLVGEIDRLLSRRLRVLRKQSAASGQVPAAESAPAAPAPEKDNAKDTISKLGRAFTEAITGLEQWQQDPAAAVTALKELSVLIQSDRDNPVLAAFQEIWDEQATKLPIIDNVLFCNTLLQSMWDPSRKEEAQANLRSEAPLAIEALRQALSLVEKAGAMENIPLCRVDDGKTHKEIFILDLDALGAAAATSVPAAAPDVLSATGTDASSQEYISLDPLLNSRPSFDPAKSPSLYGHGTNGYALSLALEQTNAQIAPSIAREQVGIETLAGESRGKTVLNMQYISDVWLKNNGAIFLDLIKYAETYSSKDASAFEVIEKRIQKGRELIALFSKSIRKLKVQRILSLVFSRSKTAGIEKEIRGIEALIENRNSDIAELERLVGSLRSLPFAQSEKIKKLLAIPIIAIGDPSGGKFYFSRDPDIGNESAHERLNIRIIFTPQEHVDFVRQLVSQSGRTDVVVRPYSQIDKAQEYDLEGILRENPGLRTVNPQIQRIENSIEKQNIGGKTQQYGLTGPFVGPLRVRAGNGSYRFYVIGERVVFAPDLQLSTDLGLAPEDCKLQDFRLGESFSVGREEGNNFHIDDSNLSGKHFSIKVTRNAAGETVFEISDHHSTNGIYVESVSPSKYKQTLSLAETAASDQAYEGGEVAVSASAFSAAFGQGSAVEISPEHRAVLEGEDMGPDFRAPEVRLISRSAMGALAPGKKVLRQGDQVLVEDAHWNDCTEQEQLDILMHEAMADWMERKRPAQEAEDTAMDLEGLKVDELERRAAHQGLDVDRAMSGEGTAGAPKWQAVLHQAEEAYSRLRKLYEEGSEDPVDIQTAEKLAGELLSSCQEIIDNNSGAEIVKRAKEIKDTVRIVILPRIKSLARLKVKEGTQALAQKDTQSLMKELLRAESEGPLRTIENALYGQKTDFFGSNPSLRDLSMEAINRKMLGSALKAVSVPASKAIKEIPGNKKIAWLIKGPITMRELRAIINSPDERAFTILRDEEQRVYILLVAGRGHPHETEQYASFLETHAMVGPILYTLGEGGGHSHPRGTDAEATPGADYDKEKKYDNFVIAFNAEGRLEMNLQRQGSSEFENIAEKDIAGELARIGILKQASPAAKPQFLNSGYNPLYIFASLLSLFTKRAAAGYFSLESGPFWGYVNWPLVWADLQGLFGKRRPAAEPAPAPAAAKTEPVPEDKRPGTVTYRGYDSAPKHWDLAVALLVRKLGIDEDELMRRLNGKTIMLVGPETDALPNRLAQELDRSIIIAVNPGFETRQEGRVSFIGKRIQEIGEADVGKIDFIFSSGLFNPEYEDSIQGSENGPGRGSVYLPMLKAMKGVLFEDGQMIIVAGSWGNDSLMEQAGSAGLVGEDIGVGGGSTPIYRLTHPQNQQPAPGGIDFRALPMTIKPVPAMAPGRQATVPPALNISLDKEWSEIERMINAGIIPSIDRLKEYLESCGDSERLGRGMDKVIACIADILRIEEDRCELTDSALKQLLVLLESNKPAEELQVALLSIQASAKDPVAIEQ